MLLPFLRGQSLYYIDLGSQAALSTDLQTFVIEEIGRQLEQDYGVDIYSRGFVQSAYRTNVVRFEKGLYGGLKDSNPQLYHQKLLEELERLISQRDQHLG